MTALVLSGGGIWAVAGLGVAQALREMHLTIDGYVGTSAGAMVSTLLALGHPPHVLRKAALDLRSNGYLGILKQWSRALMRGHWPHAIGGFDSIFAQVHPLWDKSRWEDLSSPAWVVTTSLRRRHPVVFGPGFPHRTEMAYRLDLDWGATNVSLQQAVIASMAFPGLMDPVIVPYDVLVDGGVTDDYPLDVAQWMGADRIVGVWIDEKHLYDLPHPWHAGHVASGAITAMVRELSVLRLRQVTVPRVDVRIPMDGGHRVWNRVEEIIERGYQETWMRQAELEALVGLEF